MKRNKQKGYRVKKSEHFPSGPAAHERADALRGHKHVSHVIVTTVGGSYEVAYSVAAFYLEDLTRAGSKL